MGYSRQIEALERHLSINPFLDYLNAAKPGTFDGELWNAVLEQAGRFAEAEIEPLGGALDRNGAGIAAGRVKTDAAHHRAWERFSGDGWLTLSAPEALGGQGMPLLLATACEELFNRASPAFMMLATPNRTAASMLASADETMASEWVPRLLSGEWGATICISEPDAGSDVGRIRTRAVRDDEGTWRVTGEKCWISFGDHDLTSRIGHCMLARSSDAVGVRGLSLFLVPNLLSDGGANSVVVRRIEEKLGLHGSPTCSMGFEKAQALLIGAEGRGLQTLFHMMLLMRLSCAPQGVGVAEAALSIATDYAVERRQGGDPGKHPVAIRDHADVQRQLLRMAGRVEVARGVSLATAAALDLSEIAGERDRSEWLMLAQFLLPIAKDMSARLAFDVASDALQVLGGAGYTREWPVERYLRDARVFAVFEGTTGIQAIDMVHRRLGRDGAAGLRRFVEFARADLADMPESASVAYAIDKLEETAGSLSELLDVAREADAGATAFLDLCGLAVSGWIALRVIRFGGDDRVGKRLAAAASFHLAELSAEIDRAAALAVLGASRLDAIDDYLA